MPTILACTGVLAARLLPLPSWPMLLSPQVQTVPSLRSATLWTVPAATAVIPPRYATCTGVVDCVVLPLPSWPLLLLPHAHTVPSFRNVTVCAAPVATCGVTACAVAANKKDKK